MKMPKRKSKGSEDLKPKAVKGRIVSFRTGPRTQHPNEGILRFPEVMSSGDAAQLIGRKVGWPVGQRKIRGKIIALHGKGGHLRARFRKGLPGEALGTLVEIIG
jgi:large subunit ribosomal protein L35Ae